MPRDGLLIVRAWIEVGSSKPLRVNMRFTTEVSEGFQSEANFADAAAAGAAVQVWLEDLEERERALRGERGHPNGEQPPQ